MDVRSRDVYYYEQDPLPGDLLKELISRFSDEGDIVTTFNGPENFFGRKALGLLRKAVVYCGTAPCDEQVDIICKDCTSYFQVNDPLIHHTNKRRFYNCTWNHLWQIAIGTLLCNCAS